MKNCLFLLATFAFYSSVSAQLNPHKYITWKSAEEEALFIDFVPTGENLLQLDVLSNTTLNEEHLALALDNYSILLQTIDRKKVLKKPLIKQVEIITKLIQEKFFKTSKFGATPAEILSLNTYDPNSAHLLLAMVLSDLKIECQFSSSILGFFVFINRNETALMVGKEIAPDYPCFLSIDLNIKKAMARTFKQMGFIAPEMSKTHENEELFDQIFLNLEPIGKDKFASALYINLFLKLLKNGELELACDYLRRSIACYELHHSETLLAGILVSLAKKTGSSDPKSWEYHFEVIERRVGNGSVEHAIEVIKNSSYFAVITNDTDIFNRFRSQLNNLNVPASLSQHLGTADHFLLATKAEFDKDFATCIEHSEAVLETWESDTTTHALLGFSLMQEAFKLEYHLIGDYLYPFKERYPALTDDPNYNYAYTAYLFTVGTNAYLNNEVLKADKYTIELQALIEKFPQWEFDPIMVASMYGEAWRAYTRLNNTKKSRWAIEQGLLIDPDNEQLLHYRTYFE